MATPNFYPLVLYCSLGRLQPIYYVVCRLHYINTLKQELNGTKAYEETSIDEKSVVYSHSNEIPNKFAVYVTDFLRCIGYPSFIKDHIRLASLQILALVQLQKFQNY